MFRVKLYGFAFDGRVGVFIPQSKSAEKSRLNI
jgi:hypothetical protein